jgi:hypothetical protein
MSFGLVERAHATLEYLKDREQSFGIWRIGNSRCSKIKTYYLEMLVIVVIIRDLRGSKGDIVMVSS